MTRPFLIAWLLVTTVTRLAAAQPWTLIEGATLVDPAASPPARVVSVLVRGDRVEAVAPRLERPPFARVIEGRGRFIVPGLWDMHGHLAALGPIGRAPEHFVGHGVLHVRDMGGYLDQLTALRADIATGRRVGPTLRIAGPTLNSEHPADFHRTLTTAGEARGAVRELKAAGVDHLKVHRATTREVFEAVIDEGRRVGLPVVGHVPLTVSWVDASRAGMRTIEHIQTIFENLQPDLRLTPERFSHLADDLEGALGDEIFGVLKANGTWFDPTLIGYEAAIDGARPEAAAARRQAYGRMKAIAAKAARAGVPIVTGTDVIAQPGEMLLRELERLVEIGMSAPAVLTAATITSATAAGRPELGRVRAGGPASFLLVDANPLDDIAALRRLSLVVHQGRVFTVTDLAALRQE
jgi:imidazolonepropionase-like amidohydrolase